MVSIATAILTVAILVFGEITPKNLPRYMQREDFLLIFRLYAFSCLL